MTVDLCCDDGSRISLRPGSPTTAFLCIPKITTSERKVPAVLVLHPTDNNISRRSSWAWAESRIDNTPLSWPRGYVTIAQCPLSNVLAAIRLAERHVESRLGQHASNQHARDASACRKEAIGAIGHSLGGHNAVFHGGPRAEIEAIVSSCRLGFLPQLLRHDSAGLGSRQRVDVGCESSWANLLAGRSKKWFDFHELIRRIRTRIP